MPRPVGPARTSNFVVLAAISIVVGALYFAQEVLVPLALAVLFCFLLAPLVTWLERWRLGRVPAVIAVVAVSFAAIFALGWVVSHQVVNLADNLKEYGHQVAVKVESVRGRFGGGQGGLTDKITDAVQEVQEATTRPAADSQPSTTTTKPSTTNPSGVDTGADGSAPARIDAPRGPLERVADDPLDAVTTEIANAPPKETPTTAPAGKSKENPLWVVALAEPQTPLRALGAYVGTILSPLGTAGLVLVFVIFMLIQREDLRDRLIRLIGKGQLNVTTAALDDAATRISRYMLAQAIVNGTYGVTVGLGLLAIGYFVGGESFPSFVLWGLLCAVLRFIPYIGPWIAAAFPIALSLAAYEGFAVFAWVLGMFLVIELLSNNVMEPWLYGTSTGMSTIAVLVSAVFWTWLWGPVGLLLATPLTVCLVVLGKYVPQLQFLDILLGDEQVLDPPTRVYQRLLALDQEEATDLARQFLKEGSLETVYDQVLTPALGMAEQDRHRGRLDEGRQTFIKRAMRDIVEELADEYKLLQSTQDLDAIKQAAADTVAVAKGQTVGSKSLAPGGGGNGSSKPANPLSTLLTSPSRTAAEAAATTAATPPGERAAADPLKTIVPPGCTVNVLCLPAHDEADEIVALMLVELLGLQGYCAHAISVTSLASEMVEAVEAKDADVVVVSAMPPAAVTHSRYLCKRLHARFPDISMVVGLWTAKGDLKRAKERVTCIGSVRMSTTLVQALDEVRQLAQPAILAAAPTATVPAAAEAAPSR